MDVLCFDIGSGGITAGRFNETLDATSVHEVSWDLHRDAQGRATLSADHLESAIEQLVRACGDGPPIAAVSIGCFMHSFLVLSSCCAPLTPVFTWMDTTASEGLELIRRQMGGTFHHATGCHYHPMFPVFKLAANTHGRGNRVASPKAFLVWELTGAFVDDFGMASASGLLELRSGTWHSGLLNAAGLEPQDLPQVQNPTVIVGTVTEAASRKYGIRAGTPVINGSGDGFLANVGSGCALPRRIAVTLGTSAVARQTVSEASTQAGAGTFCYRATSESFLLGCASSNGGNALDWASQVFGSADSSHGEPPIFLPWLNGERSIEWNPALRASWHGVTAQHFSGDLIRAVEEGVLFNLAQYVEVVQKESGIAADELVLSGNGFLNPSLAAILAGVVSAEVLLPESPGLASLRGAAIYAWRGLGHDASSAMERLLGKAERIGPVQDRSLRERFARFKSLRTLGTTQ